MSTQDDQVADPHGILAALKEFGLYSQCTTPAQARAVLRNEVESEVGAMLELVADADAFDVIELMRLREFPLAGAPDLNADGSGLVVEIVAAMLLGRGSRKPDPTPRDQTRPHEAISELHDRAARLGRIAAYRQMFDAHLAQNPVADVAAEYQGAVLNIRNLQYDTVRDTIESQLFGDARVVELMTKHLGYSYPDVVRVRRAMTDIGGDRLTALRNETADIVVKYQGSAPEDVPEEAKQAFLAGMVPFMFLPADRAAISAEEVADASELSVATVNALLGSCSQTFDGSTPSADRVYDLLTHINPFAAKPLLFDGVGNYAETTNGVGLDSIRRTFEAALIADQAGFTRYDQKVRKVVTERLALAAVGRLLHTTPMLDGAKYYAPEKGIATEALGHDCADLKAVGKLVEGDGLFVLGDLAVCVEVKGKSMSAQARRGDVNRLMRDLQDTIGHGCEQAARLRDLILTNGGLWLGDGRWHDLSHVREVQTIVALLDDVGPLGTNLGDLQRAGVLPADGIPWVTSLHDLETIARVCDRPSEFLLYLRRRTDSDVAKYFNAVDELDLFMLFMSANLFVEPDPDAYEAEFPNGRRPTAQDRKARARSAVHTMVDDHCGPLNAWMAREQLADITPSAPTPEKPTYNAPPRVLDLIDTIDEKTDRMVRFGADLLAMSGEAQEKILGTVDRCVHMTAEDGKPHRAAMSLAGVWGHPSLFIETCPCGSSLERSAEGLLAYIELKRHQWKSDRSYGLVFDHSGALAAAMYFNSPVGEDAELDAVIEDLGLHPIQRRPPVPPSARRPTRQLRGKKRRR